MAAQRKSFGPPAMSMQVLSSLLWSLKPHILIFFHQFTYFYGFINTEPFTIETTYPPQVILIKPLIWLTLETFSFSFHFPWVITVIFYPLDAQLATGRHRNRWGRPISKKKKCSIGHFNFNLLVHWVLILISM